MLHELYHRSRRHYRRPHHIKSHLIKSLRKVKSNYVTGSIIETVTDFCKETSIHGCRFIFEDIEDGHSYMRTIRRIIAIVTWLTFIFLGLIFAFYLMRLIWDRYQRTPTFTTVETNNYPIWNVPFPAVTICNVNSVYKPNTKKLSHELRRKGFSNSSIDLYFQSLSALISFDEIDREFLSIWQALEDIGYTTEKIMFEVRQPCRNLLKGCIWLGKEISCRQLFRIAKTSEGFCCSFNYKALREEFEIETKADDYYQINTPVIRISGAGEDVGLHVLLDVEPSEYVAAKRFFYGAEIIIHDAEDFPEKSLLTAFGQPGLEVSIAVLPSVVVTENNAKSLPVNLRFCRFSYEKKLEITKKYSFQSCITECRAYTVLQKCDCLPFFYPPLYFNNYSAQYRQCTLKDVKCLSDNKHVFASLEPPLSVKEQMYNIINTTNIGMNCDCLPSCSEQIYNAQTFISQRFDEINKSFQFSNTSSANANFTLIKVYFKDLSCIKYRREIFMTWDALLASFGGIFGLCLGGSVLSIVEIIYFVTFKFYAKFLHNKAEYEKHKKEHQIIRNNPHFLNFNKTSFVPITRVNNNQQQFLW